MIENSVVSCPPCCVALDVNAPPTLPCNAPRAQSAPAWSRKFAICDGRSAEPCASADDDRVVGGEVVDLGDWRDLIDLEMRFARDILGHQLWHTPDVDVRTAQSRSFGDSVRHRFDMTVGRVVEHQNVRHNFLLNRFAHGNAERLRRESTMASAASPLAAPSRVSADRAAASDRGIACLV